MKAASSNDGTAQYHIGVMCEKGYIERTPIGSLTKVRERCTNCYGKGYTLEYYY